MIFNKAYNYEDCIVERMIQRPKFAMFTFFLTSFIILAPTQIFAEEAHLIVRVVDADYPPAMTVYEEDNLTRFTFTLDYQVENPSDSSIKVTYVCAPFPFPRLKANLLNKSLEIKQLLIIEWIAGDRFIIPGIKNKSYIFAFDIINHEKKQLPQGNYEMWFDYTNCSSVPVPVDTEKMYIDVSESSITYYFGYNNESRIVSRIEENSYSMFSIISLLITQSVIVILNRKKFIITNF